MPSVRKFLLLPFVLGSAMLLQEPPEPVPCQALPLTPSPMSLDFSDGVGSWGTVEVEEKLRENGICPDIKKCYWRIQYTLCCISWQVDWIDYEGTLNSWRFYRPDPHGTPEWPLTNNVKTYPERTDCGSTDTVTIKFHIPGDNHPSGLDIVLERSFDLVCTEC